MLKRLSLIIFDIAWLVLALYLSLQLRYGIFDIHFDFIDHLWLFGPVFLLWLVVFYINQLYDYFNFSDYAFLLYACLRSAAANFIITIIIFYVIPSLTLAPKTILVLTIIISSGLILLTRILFNQIFSLDNLRRKLLIVGNNKIEISLAKEIKQNRAYGWRIIGFVTTNPGHRLKNFRKLGPAGELDKILEHKSVDAIAFDVARYQNHEALIQTIADYCTAKNIEILDIYTLYERLTGKVPLANLPQLWFTNINQSAKRFTSFFKRLIDILISAIGLLVFLPFIPLLYILVKLDSPGPFFFVQERMGENNQVFNLYKIRTFRHDGSQADRPTFTKTNDSRITFVGKFLRQTRIDELPQLYNILLGQMSIVGPRPERPEFIDKLTKRQKLYYKRHLIKPGLTGWAQINLGYGASYKDADKKLQYDLYYLKNRSLFLDLLIILQTVRIIIMKQGR